MSNAGYTVLGWAVWQVGKRLTMLWVKQNRAKVGAAGVVGLVLVGGVLAAKASSGDD
jgi:hypothetical protein